MNIIVTGYYQEKNLGDDLFEQIGKIIFTEKNFKEKINIIDFIKIDKINTNDVYYSCDKLILFGGETLNDYFLDKIILFKNKHINCEIYGIGVSTNQSYISIQNKINIFDKIIFRNNKDYEYFKNRLNNYVDVAPDIVFTTKYKKPIFSRTKNNAGIFIATPLYYNLSVDEKDTFLKNIRGLINTLLSKSYTIYFFPMCCNGKEKEDDYNLIVKIVKTYTDTQKKKIRFFNSNTKIIKKIPEMKINFCWRFHSVVLSIIYNIPFITFSNTPKVTNILKDFNLNNLSFPLHDYDIFITYLENNISNIKKSLLKIYTESNKKAIKVYNDFSNYNSKKDKLQFYINENDIKYIVDYVKSNYNKYLSKIDDDYNTNLILFSLSKTINSKYFYGLRQKIYMGINKLELDIKWIINDLIENNDEYFYHTVSEILKKSNNKIEIIPGTINMTFINQNDYDGLHRAGWTYVINNIKKINHTNGILCDFYVDRTFHWNNIIYYQLKTIPYLKPWIGFIHHTIDTNYSDYNTTYLFKNKLFIQSLKYCKGLIVLSSDLKSNLETLIKENNFDTPVFVICHPTEFIEESKQFNILSFKKNQHKKIIQIGAWMRDTTAIFNLKLLKEISEDNVKYKLNKAALIGKKMEGYYNLDDHDYQNALLSELDNSDSEKTKKKKSNFLLSNSDSEQSYENDFFSDELTDFKAIKNDISDNDSLIPFNSDSIDSIDNINNIFSSVSRDNRNNNRKISINNNNNNVEIIRYLENDDYDKLLKSNIVFIKLLGASAVNTVIECVVRNTPIIINKLPAIVEVLGEHYPLYYNTLEEATNIITIKNIEKAYNYLKKMDKSQLKMESFNKNFEDILKQLKY
jgi:hypothetical protein